MNRYVEKLHQYLETHTPNYGDDDTHSLLEMLYNTYTLSNPIDSKEIRRQFKELDTVLSKLSLTDNNAVFLLVCEICTVHERKAFLEGVHVGLRLFAEINEPSNGESSPT